MLLFDIKRYAINDGPGIRITLFMKGCPLSCIWCHNPEGISPATEKLYTKKKCIGCQTCVKKCPNHALTLTPDGIVTDKSLCTVCGKCAQVCPTLAMQISGEQYTTEQVMKEIEKETLVLDNSKGGVTFCGGEPLMHPNDLLELLKRCGELSIHRAVDTTLFANPEVVRQIMQHCELFLVDLKLMDSEAHKRYTGVPNETIHANLKMVAEAGIPYWIRIPLIEGVNADEDNLSKSAAFLASLPTKPEIVNLLPYHDIGKGKHEKRGTQYNPTQISMSAPSEEKIQHAIQLFEASGIKAQKGG